VATASGATKSLKKNEGEFGENMGEERDVAEMGK